MQLFPRGRDFILRQLNLRELIIGDSRFASLIHYSRRRISALGKAGWFLAVMALAAGLAYYALSWGLSVNQALVFFLLISAVGLWLSEAIPPFAVGIFIIGFLVFSQGPNPWIEEPLPVENYVNTWSSPVIWLLLGGFFLAEALQKMGLDLQLFQFTLRRFGKKPHQILLGMMLTTTLGSMLISNTAMAAMMMASVMPLIKRKGPRHPLSRALLIGVPAAASIGGMGTIIGSPPNAIAVGALQAMGLDIDFLTWMIYGVPVALALSLAFWALLTRSFRSPDLREKLDLSFLAEAKLSWPAGEGYKSYVVVFTLIVTIGLWLSSPWHGIPVAVVSALPIVALTMSSVIWASDVRSLPWDTLMLVAGGLALGLALTDSGLADFFVQQLDFDWPLYLFLPLLGLVTVLFSNIMSNTATTTIMVPLALLLLQGDVVGMTLAALTIALSASCALLLPVSTPPNAIAFSTGYLEQKDFRLGGLFFGLLGPLLAAGWGALVYALVA